MRRFLIVINLAFTFVFPVFAAEQVPKNIILVIGDGMGPAYTTAYRYYVNDFADTNVIAPTIFDQMLVGTARTYPAAVSGAVTDSAASATAMSAGIKTYNGAIAVDETKRPVSTVLELAKSQGRKTGIAVTSQIVHATPAAFIAHNPSRKNYDQIADDYFDKRLNGRFKVDVMLGGGWQYFIRDDRNLVEEFTQAGYHYADTWQGMAEAPLDQPLLGLFADVGLPWRLDFPEEHRLLSLTQNAVKRLQNDQGYFLLVEASQVDWAGHANDIAAAMAEMDDLAETLTWLKNYVDNNGETLLVVTADHSTGGLTLGRDGEYQWSPKLLHDLNTSPQSMAARLIKMKGERRTRDLESALGVKLTKDQSNTVNKIEQEKDLLGFIKGVIDEQTFTGWTTSGHTAVDVPVMSWGVARDHFRGHIDNTDIGTKLKQLLELKN